MADNERFRFLFKQYATKEAAEQERTEFFGLIDSGTYNDLLLELIDEQWNGVIPEWIRVNDVDKAEENFEAIMTRVKVKKISLVKRISVAAAIILLLGLGSYLFFVNRQPNQPTVADTQDQRFKNDVNPGKFKARLTLADGTVIVLDSVAEGQLTTQGNTAVVNKDGQLVYQGTNTPISNNSSPVYNTLATSKGETYTTVLSDGTKVWLNSASSIRFIVGFAGEERRVELDGEAYFEVRHNASKPFRVIVNGMEIEDLGTEFNINAYGDEPVVSTTLVSGSASVKAQSSSKILKPGQQAVASMYNNTSPLSIQNDVDIDQVTAWKNGVFSFDAADVQSIMRVLARWYDLDVVYEGKPANTLLHLEASRNTSLKNVLKVLELTSNMRFVIDGKKVTILK